MKDVELIPVVIGLTEKTAQIAELLYLAHKAEYCYPYAHFVDNSDATLDEVREFMQTLKKLGLVKTYRGLMTDDGEVAGSGFAIPSDPAAKLIELALYRYNYNDRPFGRPSDFVPKSITVGEYRYVLSERGLTHD